MNITDVKIRKTFDDGPMKAIASVTLDEQLAVHDIKVIEGNEGYFIAMPSRKTGEGEYKDIAHPIKTETREELIKVILAAFEEEKLKPEETRQFVEYSFRDGSMKTTGTDIDKIMPPVSRFGGGREKKKQGVIAKLLAFFERFFGLGN